MAWKCLGWKGNVKDTKAHKRLCQKHQEMMMWENIKNKKNMTMEKQVI
jgi:hypothetical protein